MFNHNRGLWGYTGVAADGLPLTIQSTGMGGPSAAIVLEELIALGVARAIRVGTAGALDPALAPRRPLIAERGDLRRRHEPRARRRRARRRRPGARRGARGRARRGAARGAVVTSDLFYEVGEPRFGSWRRSRRARRRDGGGDAVRRRPPARRRRRLRARDHRRARGGRERIDADALVAAGLAVGRLARALAALRRRLTALLVARDRVVAADRPGDDAAGAAADEDPVGLAVADARCP